MVCEKCGFDNKEDIAFCANCQVTLLDDDEFLEDLEPLSDATEERVRTMLSDKVDITGELGRGGMAIVYQATDHSLKRRVAVKCLPFESTHDRTLVNRFRREAQLAAGLNHPHIVPIYSVGSEEDLHYFTMAFMGGGSLSDRIERGLSLEDAVTYTKQIASALDYAHTKGLIHRDIKPANIMFDENDHVRVLDFGIARIMREARQTITRAILGTPEYMSPEQALSKEIDGRSDLYALGVMFYQMVTGHLPFRSEEPLSVIYQHVNERPAAPTRLNKDVPSAISKVILKLMNKDPAKRYATGTELLEALEKPEILDALKPNIRDTRGTTGPIASTVIVSNVSDRAKRLYQQGNPLIRGAMVVVPLVAVVMMIWLGTRPDPAPEIVDLPPEEEATIAETMPPPPDPKSTKIKGPLDKDVTVPQPRLTPEVEEKTQTDVSPKPVKTQPKQNKPKPVEEPEIDPRERRLAAYIEKMQFIEVIPETFRRGARFSFGDSSPAKKIDLSIFSMSRTEVTQELWELVMEDNPSCTKGLFFPVENVSWDQVQIFLTKLEEAGLACRLPTEAEFEYVDEIGRRDTYGTIAVDKLAWYDRNASQTQPVGGRDPNALGFMDIQGNVAEWCNDYYGEDYYGEAPDRDPQGPKTGSERVVRGGSFETSLSGLKPTTRYHHPPDTTSCTIGFRLVRK